MRDLPQLGIVLNPVAGHGRAKNIEKTLIEYLRCKKLGFQIEKTNGSGNATCLARQMCKELDIIVAVGGDGTVNEVATGIVGSTASLAILPIGSGNDFNRIIKIPHKINLAIEAIISGTKKFIDLGRVRIKNSIGIAQIRHFINTLGIGIDAEIAKEVRKIKYLRGLPLYIVAAIKALSTYSPIEYNICNGKDTLKEKAYLLCVGNGIFEGGGFKMLPNADIADSKLNICLIRKMSAWNAIPLVPRIIKGTHGSHEMISMWESKKINISSGKEFIIHGDGEILEENAVEIKIDLIPKAISVIVPKN